MVLNGIETCVLVFGLLIAVPLQVNAQEKQPRWLLEGGIVGGSGSACPGHFAGLMGRAKGPLAIYGVVETYRCADFTGSANRVGVSLRIGQSNWFVRPGVSTGLELDGEDLSQTVGGSLTIGDRYGARVNVLVGHVTTSGSIVLFQLGGYLSL